MPMTTEEEKAQVECLKFIKTVDGSFKASNQKARAGLSQDFYRGAQWTKAEHDIYRSKGVEPITINRCKPTIRSISGTQRQNKRDIKVRPGREGTESVAKVLTALCKHAVGPQGEYVFSEVFKDGLVKSESYLRLTIEKYTSPGGDIEVSHRSLFSVDVDPAAIEYDLNRSAKFLIDRDWIDKEEIDFKYPDKADEISSGIGLAGEFDDPNGVIAYLCEDDEVDDYDESSNGGEVNRRKYRYLVREIWWKEKVPGLRVLDQATGMSRVISGDLLKKHGKRLKGDANYITADEGGTVLHKTVMVGKVVLEDEENPLGEQIQDIPYFRFSPDYDNGYAMSAIQDIISLNREENINRTLATRYLGQTVNSGWITDKGSPKAIKKLEQFGSVNGVVFSRADYGNIEKIKPNILSAGHMILSEQAGRDVKDISGVNDEMLGIDNNKVVSGKAIQLRERSGMRTNEPIFDNFDRTLQLFGDMLVKMITKLNIYTDDEIRAIVSESDLLDLKMLQRAHAEITQAIGGDLPLPANPEELAPNPNMMAMVQPEDQEMVYEGIKTGIRAAAMYAERYPELKQKWDDVIKQHAIELLLKELRDDKVGQYGIVVSLSASAPTVRMQNMLELEMIQDKYGMIPPDVFIDATELANKDEIKAGIQQMMQAQAPPPKPAAKKKEKAA